MTKKRRKTKSLAGDAKNITTPPTISETQQAQSSNPTYPIITKLGKKVPYDIANLLNVVAWEYAKRKALFALGYARRREILYSLEHQSKGTTEIRDTMGKKVSAPNIKGHLDVLVDIGLVSVNNLVYKLTETGKILLRLMKEVKEEWLDEFSTEEGSTKRVDILQCLFVQSESKFDEIVSAIGINKSEVHRFLKSLINAGFVEKGSARFDPYAITKDGRSFYRQLELLIEELTSHYANLIDESKGTHHRFLLSPKQGIIKLNEGEAVVGIENKKFHRFV